MERLDHLSCGRDENRLLGDHIHRPDREQVIRETVPGAGRPAARIPAVVRKSWKPGRCTSVIRFFDWNPNCSLNHKNIETTQGDSVVGPPDLSD